jgi:hypothetical protein
MTTEVKTILGISFATMAILIGGVFFLSQERKPPESVPRSDIVAENGIHWHPKLAIYIKGKKYELEDGIGIGAVHQKIHTHSEDYKEGVIHMEMSGLVTKEDTKLGNFFKIWGKPFSKTQILDKKNGEEGKVSMKINGKQNSEFENYHMRDGDMIEIRYE